MLPQCNETNRGLRRLHVNRMGNDKALICVKENRVYQWQFVDGSPTYGESVNPAKDCSDVVNNVPEAEDGFYWVSLNKPKPHQVWCDVKTDGGGFMLVGMKDSPVSWTVSSSSAPVDPQGPPHWSSVFGDVKILDFGIQVATDSGFEKTKAHWLYRLNPKRAIGNLFSVDKGGCSSIHPGIGNVTYIKDVLTQSVVTTNFQCSKFGPHTHPQLGWGRMNYCLRHDCKYGYAILPGLLLQYDNFGSFSYSAVSTSSGIGQNSTAFVGCDHGKCCACFGPKGGRMNYCGPKCRSINGGTVSKTAFAWFWVRSSLPKRAWKRCMEFKMKTANGKLEDYFIDPNTGTAHKGSCSYQIKALLNAGTLLVADKASLQNVPPIPGLLSYRADNKQLYVNEGSRWHALSREKEVHQLKNEMRMVKNDFENRNNKTKRQEKKFKILESKFKGHENKLQSQENKLKSQENKLKSQENKLQSQENKSKSQGNKLQSQENKLRSQENKLKSQENKLQSQENKSKNQENKLKSQESKLKSQESKSKSQENKLKNQENKLKTQESELKNQENKLKSVQKTLKDLLIRLNTAPAASCKSLRKRNLSFPSGFYYINPDGKRSFRIYCDMTLKNGVGVAVLGHNSEAKMKVDGYELRGSYRRKIKYNVTIDKITAIIKTSNRCEQFIKYQCYGSVFGLSTSRPTAWWVSRQGGKMKYWGGAAVQSGKCACGMTNSCARGRPCNCDANDGVLREDSGFLTDKNTLPVMDLRFGDTGTPNVIEYGYHTLGKLLCWG